MDRPHCAFSAASLTFTSGGLGALAVLLGAPSATAAIEVNTTAAGTHWAMSPAATGAYHRVLLDLDGNGIPDASIFNDTTHTTLSPDWFRIALGAGMSVALNGAYANRFTSLPNTTVLAGHSQWNNAGASIFDGALPPASTGWATWQNGPGYIGYRVDQGGGSYGYGWVLITPNQNGTAITINDWSTVSASGANGTGGGRAGAPKPFGGTPEPATSGLALLALGAAGVLRHRRRQQQAA